MVVPEREKGVKSFRIPRLAFHAIVFLCVITIFALGILSYDYWKILRQVHQNKHLTLENRQLKEQIQLFQMKINTLTEDIERIEIFEKKLRVISGFEKIDKTNPVIKDENTPENLKKTDPKTEKTQSFFNGNNTIKDKLKDESKSEKFIELKNLYEQKIATNFGLQTGYAFTKEWSDLTKQSFDLAENFADFDYKFNIIKGHVKDLELSVHDLDQFLLDRESFFRSTPTLLPAKGWVTSYYGPRISPYSNRLKMHEGLDIGASIGTPILAPADGTITFSGKKAGFGYFVQIDHGYGIETVYAHNSSNHVRKGDIVSRGQLIAKVGNTGNSTGPHLHYEIRVNGTPVDPFYYILD
jgi:murein DD-endopeptidase MepM/ murein hydrolase activator NlpD